MMKRLFMAMLCLFFSIGISVAQTRTVSGHVTSAEDGETVIGASIVVKGTTIGTVTDYDGNFMLDVPADATTLIVSYVGMEEQQVRVANQMNIVLRADTKMLEEVVVTGYGVTKKAAFTGSAQVVSSESLTRRTDDNVMKSLDGAVAGLRVNSFSGQPGAFTSTTIRGVGSANSGTEPLYVIDGVSIFSGKMGTYNQAGRGEMASSPIANLNPNDIESITVLKDATATAIYGARASNGVIVISTKKGKSGKPRLNLSAKVGTSFVNNLDENYKTTNLNDYLNIWSEGYYNAGWSESLESGRQDVLNDIRDYYGVDATQVQSVDWLDAILRNGFTQEYNLSLQGGNEALNYFISGGYYQSKGVVIGTGMERYSGRFNLDGKSNRFAYGLSTTASFADIDNSMTESQYTNPMVAVYDLRPFEQIYNADGTYNLDAYYNPVAINDKKKGDKRNQKQIMVLVNPHFSYQFIDGLTWKTNGGLNIVDLEEFFYSSIYNPQYSGSGMLGQKNLERMTTLQITNTLNFNRSFNDVHNLNLLVGQEAQKVSLRQIYASASGYPSDTMLELETAATPTEVQSAKFTSALASFFMNAEYNYNNKYYGSASFRYDGSSKFGSNNQWAPFWSVGAKYRISEEAFMENTKDWLSDLTVRGSFGTVGNQDIAAGLDLGLLRTYHPSMGLYAYGYSYNSRPGSVPYQMSNPDLKWERSEKADIGISGVLFERFSFEMDFYNEMTKDMIFNVPLSYTSGYSSVLQNIGTMQNRGFEFLLNTNIINTKDFRWDINVSGTINRNKIKKLATDKPIEYSRVIRKVGEPFHSFYLVEYAGVDAETGDPLFYRDLYNDDGEWIGEEITSDYSKANQRVVGSADPKFYGGFGMTFRLKDFDFSFDASYSLGNKVYNSGFSYDMQVGHYQLGPVSNYVYKNHWQQPGDVTDVPKFVAGKRTGANNDSSRFLMNGSYLRMKSMVLGYSIPKSILGSAGIEYARVFVSADNLFTLRAGDFIGFDPQARATGMQSWTYPVPTNVMFGLNVNF